MDIGSGNGYPSSSLSNFAGHRFIIDGVTCNSMEGFLQSLKFESPEMQEYVCSLIGKMAKFKGKPKKWFTKQELYWRGRVIDRHSDEYQNLLDRAFQAMYDQSESFRKALKASEGSNLSHSMGKSDPKKTVLTNTEFLSRLRSLRESGSI